VKSVAIVSPLLGDGKTTVAVGLAIATSRAGKRAILVDADLRRAQVSARLGVPPTDGLGSVLAGTVSEDHVLMVQEHAETPAAAPLAVLPAGPPPPNPTALVSSQSMGALLSRLESRTDLVIVDTAAALAVSDTLPLLRQVSGVVVVLRINQSSTGSVRRLKRVVEAAHGTVLGMVATGTEAGATGYGEYAYRYAPGQPGRKRIGLRRFGRSRRNGIASDLQVGETLTSAAIRHQDPASENNHASNGTEHEEQPTIDSPVATASEQPPVGTEDSAAAHPPTAHRRRLLGGRNR
jgi:capsular exopolysaccharide synthesis family protein